MLPLFGRRLNLLGEEIQGDLDRMKLFIRHDRPRFFFPKISSSSFSSLVGSFFGS